MTPGCALFALLSARPLCARARSAVLLLALAAGAAGALPATAHARAAGDPVTLVAGTHTLQLTHAGLARKALVHVPRGVDPAQPVPLLLAFHGGGGHAEFMADDARYGLVSLAEREGVVVVFPNGYSRLPGGRFATWNAGSCCGEARDRGVDDVGFVRALVAHLKTRLNVDARRIHATGMSNGGMLAHRLACEAADLFTAVAAVAGTDGTAHCAPARPVPVLHIHARNDTHVLFEGGAGPGAFRDRDQVTDFVSVPETVARWVRRNQCPGAPRRVLERLGAYCEAYEGCAGGVRVQLCVTGGGGHSWPGARVVRRGKEAASQALDASTVMWDFFRTSVPR